MDSRTVLTKLAIAMGLGLLVGLQREWVATKLAGIRTFPLITVLGAVAALLSKSYGGNGWVVAAGFLALAALIVGSNLVKMRLAHEGDADLGITTEVAALLMYGVGAYLVDGDAAAAVVVSAVVAILLYLKESLHQFVGRIGAADLKAMMQFVLITLVILPVLPNRAVSWAGYDFYGVLNPFRIWLFVVLIVGMSLVGYVLYKLFGERVGTILGGVLGGIISSTATTVSYSRRSRETPESVGAAARVIVIATAVSFARILVLIAAVSRPALETMGPPIVALLGVSVLVIAGLFLTGRHQPSTMPPQQNPSELKAALFFTSIFAVVLVASAAAKDHFHDSGLYLVGTIAGLTDVDAITLTTTQMVQKSEVVVATGWKVIVVAAMSNLVFKTGVVAVLGDRRLLGRVAAAFGVLFAAGAALLAFWW